jgi:hypothetical protein
MRKGFTRKPQGDEPATRGKNYITRSGLQRLKDEHRFLLTRERPAVTEVVAWAATNGDQAVLAIGRRPVRQDGEGQSTRPAYAGADPNPIMAGVLRELGVAA